LTYLLRSHNGWQQGMPESRRWEPANARLAPGQRPVEAGDACGIGYSGETSDPLYASGLQTWKQWYDGAGVTAPSISPGVVLEVRAELAADHGGQAWLEIACSDIISEDLQWILLERAPADRSNHFMQSAPTAYAWAFGDVQPLDGRKAVVTSRWLVPATFSCPTGRAVGRWIWKVGNTCNDVDNLGINTGTFSLDEYKEVVSSFRHGQHVQGRCRGQSPEQFLSCFVFSVDSGTAPVLPRPAPPSPESPTTPSPMPAQLSAPAPQDPLAGSQAPTPAQQCSNRAYSQCGGIGFTGAACCPDGHYCKRVSDHFSSCYSCQYFPDPACSASVLGSGAKRSVASRRHLFLGTALVQSGVEIERDQVAEQMSEEL
jgi:hypothetical protein